MDGGYNIFADAGFTYHFKVENGLQDGTPQLVDCLGVLDIEGGQQDLVLAKNGSKCINPSENSNFSELKIKNMEVKLLIPLGNDDRPTARPTDGQTGPQGSYTSNNIYKIYITYISE